MVDEALELLVRFWSGEEVTHEGSSYHVHTARLLPRPIQRPRIPIWIGGIFPLRGPVQRALRWDGACLYKRSEDGDFTPEDVRHLVRLAKTRPNPNAPFDIVVGHANWQRAKDTERERAYIASLAEAGATWRSIYISPDTEKAMRRTIQQGPLRIG